MKNVLKLRKTRQQKILDLSTVILFDLILYALQSTVFSNVRTGLPSLTSTKHSLPEDKVS